jgi:hypothetical protein
MERVLRRVALAAYATAGVLFALTLFAPAAPAALRRSFSLGAQASARLEGAAAECARVTVCVEVPRSDVVRLEDGFVFAWSVAQAGVVVASGDRAVPREEALISRSTRTLCLGSATVVPGVPLDVEVRVVQRPEGADGWQAVLVVEPDLASTGIGVRLGQWAFQVMTVCIVVAAMASLLGRRRPRA